MSLSIKIATIGFTQTTAELFFKRLQNFGVKKVIDVRLNNTSQLSGFAKSEDLKYFLKEICEIDYIHLPILAPTEFMLKALKKEKGDWNVYEKRFVNLMKERMIEKKLIPDSLHAACLLCSEAMPHNCHRRLICDYLNEKWDGRLEVKHL